MNDRIEASRVVAPPASTVRSGSPGASLTVPRASNWFGPTTFSTLPDVRSTPLSNPMIPVPPLKVPDAWGT